MTTVKIQATEHPIHKVFSEDFIFSICNFALTTQVLIENQWTPDVINKR